MRNAVLAVLVVAMAAVLWWQSRDPPRAELPDRPRAGRKQLQLPAEPGETQPVAEVEPPRKVDRAPGPPVPSVGPGRSLTISLSEDPALTYLQARFSDSDAHYRDLVRELSGGRATYDANLARAAREMVYQTTEFGEIVPSDVRDFAVASAGAVAADSSFQQLRTNSEGEQALRQAIGAIVRDKEATSDGPLFVGVGEVYRHGLQMPRHIGVVGTHLGAQMEPLPAQIALGERWRLRGRLLASWREVKALVLHPDGREEQLPVEVRGDQVAVDVEAGSIRGAMDVQFVGEGPRGPGKILQLRAWVGQAPPRTLKTRVPSDESKLRNALEAEAYAFALINADRAAHGLPALGWDPALAAIGRKHSEEMRDRDFFAHISPTTGAPGDRLKAGGYKAAQYAENVAHNGTLHEAQSGLMHSLGHRRNLLAKDTEVVGVGVALRGTGKERRFWVTQLFAKPADRRSEAELVAAVVAQIEKRRAGMGLPEARIDGALSEAAAVGARAAAAGQVDGASAKALAEAQARDLVHGRMHAWALVTPDVEKLELPEPLLAADVRAVGVAAVAEQGDGARIAVMLLISRE
jgi:uncharacterized protein YkwD